MKRRILFITSFCFYLGAIIYLCLAKPDELPQVEFTLWGLPVDKLAHCLMFFPFPILFFCMVWKKDRSIWKEFLIIPASIIIGTVLAYLTEELQALTQYRTSDIYDLYADSIGLYLGSLVIIMHLVIRILRKK